MNELSWFVYIAQVLPNLGVTMAFSALISIVMMIGFYVYGMTARSDGTRYPSLYPQARENGMKVLSTLHKIWWIPIVILFLSTLIPSKQTLYMIAASQIGEQVIQLEEVQKLGGDVGGLASDTIELLRQNIQEQLTEKPVQAD